MCQNSTQESTNSPPDLKYRVEDLQWWVHAGIVDRYLQQLRKTSASKKSEITW